MLVAVIPAYNEEKRIRAVVSETLKYVDKVVVVNDGSTDSTAQQATVRGVVVLSHAINVGKGAAVRTGCDYALSLGATQLVLLDGDGQHEPHEIPRFAQHLASHDIVFGSRTRSKKMPALMRLGNWGLTMMSKVLFGIAVEDSQGGYRAMTADAYRTVRWDSSDYGMESEMIVRAGVAKLSFTEIPIKTIYHDRYKGTGVVDGIKIGLSLLKWRLTIW